MRRFLTVVAVALVPQIAMPGQSVNRFQNFSKTISTISLPKAKRCSRKRPGRHRSS
jgi:hypothetical protein